MRINMSKEKPMGIATREPQVRYSAAYPTGAERIVKVTPLPCGLSTMVLLYQWLLYQRDECSAAEL